MNNAALPLVLAFVCVPALCAESAAPATANLEVCMDLSDPQQRLTCFDREMSQIRKPTPATSTAPKQAPAPVPIPAPVTPTFGQEQLPSKARPAAPAQEQTLHAHIAALRDVAPGNYLVTLDNGQIWSHEDPQRAAYLREGEAITISKGSLGTSRLTRDAGNTRDWIRVKRVR
jgi:hypothetical protein